MHREREDRQQSRKRRALPQTFRADWTASLSTPPSPCTGRSGRVSGIGGASSQLAAGSIWSARSMPSLWRGDSLALVFEGLKGEARLSVDLLVGSRMILEVTSGDALAPITRQQLRTYLRRSKRAGFRHRLQRRVQLSSGISDIEWLHETAHELAQHTETSACRRPRNGQEAPLRRSAQARRGHAARIFRPPNSKASCRRRTSRRSGSPMSGATAISIRSSSGAARTSRTSPTSSSKRRRSTSRRRFTRRFSSTTCSADSKQREQEAAPTVARSVRRFQRPSISKRRPNSTSTTSTGRTA